MLNFFIVCVYVHVHVHVRVCVNTHTPYHAHGEQRSVFRSQFSPSIVWVQGSESGCQDWPRAPLPVELSA